MGQMSSTGEVEVQGDASGTGGPPGSPAGLLVLVALSFIVTPIPVVIPILEALVAVSVGGLVIGLRALRQRDVQQALQRAQQLAQELQGIQDQAFTDSLTGLWNSRYLQEQLPNELSRVRRRNLQLSLLMVDVDGLKTINDRFGHATGNVLLRDIGGLLKESLRVSDIAGRWEGDEFLLILPEAGKADSLAVAKRLRFRLDQYRLRVGGQAISVGTSVGIAAYPVDGEEAGVLFERADISSAIFICLSSWTPGMAPPVLYPLVYQKCFVAGGLSGHHGDILDGAGCDLPSFSLDASSETLLR